MSTFNGYFERQFGRRIRADRFTQQDPATVLQLLSHAHADHTVGLSSKDLRGYVYCSAATKDIILRTATASERVHAEINGVKSDDYYTFRNLQEPVYSAKGKPVIRDGKKVKVDVLKPLQLDIRHDFSEYFGSPVAITLIDANHCPGAVMFLIESPEHAILYTGDVRSEPFLINSLTENPYLQDYLSLHGHASRKTLDQIYLDTSAALSKGRLLSKLEGVNEALKLFDLFPPKTRFFINSWTWGYEELLRAIAHRYRCKIHLDDYKAKIYKQSSVSQHDFLYSSISQDHPELAEIGTSTFQNTRFHACERRWKCPHVRIDGQGCFDSEEMKVIWEDTYQIALRQDELLRSKNLLPHTVFVNPADATETGWKKYKERITAQCTAAKAGHGPWPTNLLVPLARHSSLPELQDLVSLFKPHNIYPNTIYPEFQGQDYLLLAQYFASTLAPRGKERLSRDARDYQQSMAAKNGEIIKVVPSRMTSPQEDEQTQEMKEELSSKFARVSDRLPQEFLISNFDHLDNPLDLDLLITVDEDEEIRVQEEEESQISQELPEVIHPIRKVVKVSSKNDARSKRDITPPQVRKDCKGATSPAVPSSSIDAVEEAGANANPRQSVDMEASGNIPSSMDCNWLAGQVFCFDGDNQDEPEKRLQAQEAIHKAGGATIICGTTRASIETAVSVSSAVICDYRAGDLYTVAHQYQKTIGNHDWLAECQKIGQLSNPQLDLLDQPYPAGPVGILREVTISSTGFSEIDKKALKSMAVALGCRYLPELSKSQTTVLIANGRNSRKSDHARKWKLPVVNFLWLEECFANARQMPMDAARYQDLSITPEALKRRVGQNHERQTPTPDTRVDAAPAKQRHIPVVPLPNQPLQPASVKRKQQTAMSASQEISGLRSKKVRCASAKAEEKERDMPETFETVSTVNQDDTEKIRKIKEVVQKGVGLPRIASCDILE